jgi:predicted ATPase/DNA-binding SARP family transcriptional activator
VEFLVLGPVEVRAGGTPLRLAAAKPRALLATLLASANRVVASGTLLDALWGEDPPPSATKLLQVYVSQLRKELPEDVLLTRPPGYLVAVPPDALDAARFEALLAQGRAAARGGNPALASRLLGRALGEWRGAAYADVAGEEAVRAEAVRLDALRLAAEEERLAADLACGRAAAVAGAALALARAHPLRERLWALAVRALYLDGRQADALAAYADARHALVDGLGVEPGTELREVHAAVLRQDPALAETVAAQRFPPLPVPPTPLVGRAGPLGTLAALVTRDDVRLVTLTGHGGSGKTRLALALAERVADDFANGVAYVPLAAVTDADPVAPAIAAVLGVREAPRTPLAETLAAALRGLDVLLVLDNVEQVLGAATLLADLLAAAPRLTLLVTSRTLLRLSGEHVYVVPPLDDAEAATLFAQRARAVRADAGDGTTVAAICRRLDGLPLAIELAAARLRVISPGALLDRLGARLDVLGDGARDLPHRHQTLRATLEWSYDLLDAADRTRLGCLAAFAGGCSADAAAEVCDCDLDALSALADQSLLVAGEGPDGEPRFALLETTRAYAAERLDAEGGGDAARARHAAYFLDLAERCDARLGGADQGRALDLLDTEHDNLRAALDHLAASGDAAGELRLAAALGRFWYVRGHLTEGRSRLAAALSRGGAADPATRAKAQRSASALALIHGDYAEAARLAEEAYDGYLALGDRTGAARASSNLGAAVLAQGDTDRARAVLDETVVLAREIGDPRLLAIATNNRGDAALTGGDYALATECFTESLALLRSLGDTANVARSLLNLGSAALEQGRTEEAAALLAESLGLCRAVGDAEDVAWCLVAFAALAAEPVRAATLLGAADRVLGDLGALFKPYERSRYARTRDRAVDAIGAAAYDAAHAAGAARGAAVDDLLAG